MSSTGKNKISFDFKPIVVYIIFIALGFFSAKLVLGLLSKRSSAKNLPVINNASVLPSAARVPDKVAVESVVKPAVKPVIEAKVDVPALETPISVIYASAEESAKFVLNGIAFSEESEQTSYALINNKVVKIGEKVSGAKVKQIYKNSVELITVDSKIVILNQKK